MYHSSPASPIYHGMPASPMCHGMPLNQVNHHVPHHTCTPGTPWHACITNAPPEHAPPPLYHCSPEKLSLRRGALGAPFPEPYPPSVELQGPVACRALWDGDLSWAPAPCSSHIQTRTLAGDAGDAGMASTSVMRNVTGLNSKNLAKGHRPYAPMPCGLSGYVPVIIAKCSSNVAT